MKNYLSEKAKNLKPYTAGLQPKESGWIKLNTNENPYPPSPKVFNAIKDADISSLRLYSDCDSNELREAIARVAGVSAENIFVGNGSDEVLALAYQAFFMDKDNILTPSISYGFYSVWCDFYDVKAKYLPLNEDLTINLSDYVNGNGVIIANPNAPTGLALTFEEVEKIVTNNPNGVVIIDEAYIDFSNVKSAIELIGKYDNLLIVRTFSKSHSLAGLRVGYAAGNRELIEVLHQTKDSFNAYPLDILAQIGAKAAIEDVEYFDETRNRIIRTRDNTEAKLLDLGYKTTDSQTNFLFMEAENAKEMFEYLLENKILVRYWAIPLISKYLRISVGTENEMEVLVKCIEKQTKRK